MYTCMQMVITHLDRCLYCTILMSTEIISAITTIANNVDKTTITALLSLELSSSGQLHVSTKMRDVIADNHNYRAS